MSEITMRAPSGMNLNDSVYERLLRERIVFLGSQVDDPIANQICAQLLLLAAEDPERDIYLYINSPGGSVSAGMAIYDTMQYVENDVATVAMGLAACMGQFLLCAGAKGKRYAPPHARIMMHQPSGGIGGTASDIAIQAEQMLYTKRTMQERIAFHTGQTVEQIESDSDRDRWFTAEEAQEYGFIDHVVDPGRPGAFRRARSPDRPIDEGDRHGPHRPGRPAGRDHRPLHRSRSSRERTSYGFKEHRPVHEAVRGAHHLPRRADRRHVGQRRDGAAADPGVDGPRPRHLHLHQLARAARSPR